MSRAIQRLMNDYRKAEKLVGRSSNESFSEFTNTTSFSTQTYAQQMAQLRREPELTQDAQKYLVAVERKLLMLTHFRLPRSIYFIRNRVYSAKKRLS